MGEHIRRWRNGERRGSLGACWAPPIDPAGQLRPHEEVGGLEALRVELVASRWMDQVEDGSPASTDEDDKLTAADLAMNEDALREEIRTLRARQDLRDCARKRQAVRSSAGSVR